MSPIRVSGVTVDLPVFAVHARSIRKTVMNMSTGGRLFRTAEDKVLVRALDRVSFELKEGDRLGLVGHNGSGKSTLLRTLGGIYRPTAGYLSIAGRVVAVLDPATGLNPDASGRENVQLLARHLGRARREIADAIDQIAEFAGLGAFMDMPVKTYSQGMIARLAFAVGTHWDPDIVLMDEWIAVADESFKDAALDRLTRFMSAARCVVVASHDHHLLHRICNKVLILDHGSVRYFGPIEEAELFPKPRPRPRRAHAKPIKQEAPVKPRRRKNDG